MPLQPSHPRAPWWRPRFINHPGHRTQDLEAFLGGGKASGKLKVVCGECVKAAVEKQLALASTTSAQDRDVVYEEGMPSLCFSYYTTLFVLHSIAWAPSTVDGVSGF